MSTNATSQSSWTPAWVQNATGGRWLHPPDKPEAQLTGLGIDSRTLKPGHIFLAVKGEHFDGHRFIQPAFNAGATIAIIDQPSETCDQPQAGLLLVDNTLDALHQLARSHRQALRAAGCHVIAVAGSNGKTTTRHLIHTVLSSKLRGTQSPKSFNNHLGVPLTLLGASINDDFVVAEVGTNHPGEIDALGKLLQPDSAVITCIGKEHMEFFGDLQGVADEEAAITRHLPPGAKVFIEADAWQWIKNTQTYSTKTRAIVYENDPKPESFTKTNRAAQIFSISDTVTVDLPLIAPHDRLNARAAVLVGQAMGVPDNLIKTALQTVKPMPGRLEVKHFGPVTVIDDSYNANPDSTQAALDVLANFSITKQGRRLAILGDMLELGAISETSHREIGSTVLKMIDSDILHHAILIGPAMASAADELAGTKTKAHVTHHTTTDQSNFDTITDSLQPNDVVLVKGSRGLQLENLVTAIGDRLSH